MLNILTAAVLFLVALLFVLAGITRIGVWQIERRFPPEGQFATVNNTRMHFVHVPLTGEANSDALPAIVFLHGASGNLHDAMMIWRDKLEGKAPLVFVDRPGHGWSKRGPSSNALPDGQAATIAALLDHLGIDKAIIVGHSFGGAVTVSFALNHPEKTVGTVFMSPVSHPWPGGISWYYDLTALPVIGRIFSETLALPAGYSRIDGGTACVFAPNKPTENYTERSHLPLLFRPLHFRSNAIDVAGLYDHVKRMSSRYPEIATPSVIITGDRDTIVLPSIHSVGLARDLQDAKLLRIHNLGHKPDHVVSDVALAAIEHVAGRTVDLDALAAAATARLAGDAYGPLERCLDDGEIRAEFERSGYVSP